MRSKHVIVTSICLLLIAGMNPSVAASTLKEKLDSLFVIASTGDVRFSEMVEPAKDSIAAMGEQVVPHLVDKFITKSARERWTIIHILQRIGTPAVPYLVEALTRTDGLVVQRVCWALGDVGDSSAVEPLVAVCLHDRWQVRDQAVGALGKIGDMRAADAVHSALDDSVGQVRKAAAVACGKLGIGRAVQRLVHVLGDDFYGARLTAAESLVKLDTPIVTGVLADSLDSPNRLVGDLACSVLGQYGTDEALTILMSQAESTDPERRAHAAVAVIAADPDDTCGYHELLFEREQDSLVLLKMKSALSAASHE